MISEWCQHHDETIAAVSQGKDAELVEDGRDGGDGRKQPVEVILLDSLREEGDNSEELSCVTTKPLEHGGRERELNRISKALVVLCLKHARLASLPLLDRSFVVPVVLMRDSSQ